MSNVIKNYYADKSVKRFIKNLPNPSYDNHKISLPARVLIVGGSGSGKTNLLMEFINRAKGTFCHLIVCVKNKDEPIYQALEHKLKDMITFYEDGLIPTIEDASKKYITEKNDQGLIVFDDLVLENKLTQSKIAQWFIRSRKKNWSCFYLTQSYFQTPKVIRINCNYIWLKKLSSTKDLGIILRDFNLGIDQDDLYKMYSEATDDPYDFLMVDIAATTAERFRHNFLHII